MEIYSTALGDVKILDARIIRASGYGQYNIVIDIVFEGERKTLKEHTTDSQLWDNATDEDIAVDGHSAYLMENAKYTIESAIDNYISSL